MKLTNMAYDKDDDDNYGSVTTSPGYSSPKYPCGLSLWLSPEQCERLGVLGAVAPGTAIRIEGQAIVTRSETSLDSDADSAGDDVCLTMQITDFGIEPMGVIPNAAEKLYGQS